MPHWQVWVVLHYFKVSASFHHTLAFRCTIQNRTRKCRLIKLDLYFNCSPLCSIVVFLGFFLQELQMLGSVPLCVCMCVYTNGITATFFFFSYSACVATSPFLMLCSPTQNGAILSPSVPEMKYKPLKCILILPCRPRLKNKHVYTHTHIEQTLTKEVLWCQPLFLRPRLYAYGRWLLLLLCMPPY